MLSPVEPVGPGPWPNINATVGNADAEDDGLIPGMGKAEGWGSMIGMLLVSCCCCCFLLICCRRKKCDHGNDPDECKECDCPCGNIRGECPECNAKVIDEHPPSYFTHHDDGKKAEKDDANFTKGDLAGVVPGLGSDKVDIEMARQGPVEVVNNTALVNNTVLANNTAPILFQDDSTFDEDEGDGI